MWSKEEAENKIFDALEFIDTVIIGYVKTFYGILVHPKRTLEYLHKVEVISPFIFFLLNLLVAGVLASFGNICDFISKVLKSLVLTTKPSFDDAFFSMLGLLSGTLIFLFLFRLICLKAIKERLPYVSITKPILYASFLFMPISILKDIISYVFTGQMFRVLGGDSNLIVLILTVFIANILILWWWSYIINLGLKIQIGGSLKFSRSILFTLLIFVAVTAVTSNIENLEKLSTLTYLIKYKSATNEALAKQPPDYFTAAMSTGLISQSKVLVPYRRYCESIRSIVYLSMLIKGFDSDYTIKSLSNNRFEEIQSYFYNVYDKVNASPHTPNEFIYLKILNETLHNADKIRKDENYIQGVYETTFGLQFGLSTSKEGIRIVP